jgi:plasmid stability protein
MGQILIRQLDDATIARLKLRAREKKTSVEALAREAIRKVAELSVEEKLALVRRSHEWSRNARVPAGGQTSGVDLIREDRDHDH